MTLFIKNLDGSTEHMEKCVYNRDCPVCDHHSGRGIVCTYNIDKRLVKDECPLLFKAHEDIISND